MIKYLLITRYAGLAVTLWAASGVLGAYRFLVAIDGASTSPGDYIQGGVAVAAIGFAGGVVKFMGTLVEKERSRGDRLETTLIDKALPAMTSSASALDGMQTAMREMSHRLDDYQRRPPT